MNPGKMPEDRCPNCFDRLPCPEGCGNKTPVSPAGPVLSPGTVLNPQYIVGRVLGQGGFGITYLGWDCLLEGKVAVKEYFPRGLANRAFGSQRVTATLETLADFDQGMTRFLDEARIVRKFKDHANIVRVENFFSAHGTAYMILEFLDGMTFEKFLQQQEGQRASLGTCVRVMSAVFDALESVHASNVLHRDISPDNIYLLRNGTVKLIDFGAARQAMGTETHSLTTILKPGYAPIEQYQERGHAGAASDIYAAAATLYRGLTGIRPAPSPDRMFTDPLLPPSQHGIHLPASAEAALMKGLSMNPEDRYPQCRQFHAALLAALHEPMPTHAIDSRSQQPIIEAQPEVSEPVAAPQPTPSAQGEVRAQRESTGEVNVPEPRPSVFGDMMPLGEQRSRGAGWRRWLIPGLAVSVALTAAVVLILLNDRKTAPFDRGVPHDTKRMEEKSDSGETGRATDGAQAGGQSIAEFTVQPESIRAGEEIRLKWAVEGGRDVIIEGIGPQPPRGVVSIRPQSTQVFRLKAVTSSGLITRSVQVNVRRDEQVPIEIVRFDSSPTNVTSGQTAMLSWVVSRAAKVYLDGVRVDAEGSKEVNPTSSASYTLVAKNDSGQEIRRTLVLTVRKLQTEAEILRFTFDPEIVERGAESRLAWAVRNARSVRLDGQTVNPEGTLAVQVTQSLNKELIVEGFDGKVRSARASVQTRSSTPPQLQIQLFKIEPDRVSAGQLARMSWSVSGAQRITITPEFGAVSFRGERQFLPGSTTRYVLTAVGANGKVEVAEATVRVD